MPYEGLAESRSTLGLPDIARLGSVAALLGGTTRTRVWWSAADSWRVDVLTTGGEQGTYAQPGSGVGDVVEWDFGRNEIVNILGGTGVRLPRADDLVAPTAARRLLTGVGVKDPVLATDGGACRGAAAPCGTFAPPMRARRSAGSTSGSTTRPRCRCACGSTTAAAALSSHLRSCRCR